MVYLSTLMLPAASRPMKKIPPTIWNDPSAMALTLATSSPGLELPPVPCASASLPYGCYVSGRGSFRSLR